MDLEFPRIITIDGPSGSGKGTISQLLATQLGWHLLDSGVLYRIVGLVAILQNLRPTDPALLKLTQTISIKFIDKKILLQGQNIAEDIRTESVGNMASQIAAFPAIRSALLAKQRSFARPPGLVADGRDMGTLVFPDAQIKIFLTASAEERAKRRYNQLKEQGLHVNLEEITRGLYERDERDQTRSAAPLKAAASALVIDSTGITIKDVLQQLLTQVKTCFPELRI